MVLPFLAFYYHLSTKACTVICFYSSLLICGAEIRAPRFRPILLDIYDYPISVHIVTGMVLRLVMRLVYLTATDRFDKSDIPVISFKYSGQQQVSVELSHCSMSGVGLGLCYNRRLLPLCTGSEQCIISLNDADELEVDTPTSPLICRAPHHFSTSCTLSGCDMSCPIPVGIKPALCCSHNSHWPSPRGTAATASKLHQQSSIPKQC